MTIYTVFLKLKVQRMGSANPTMTKRMSARRYMRGMRNYSVVSMGVEAVCFMME